MVVSKASNAAEATSSKTMGLLETGGSANAKVNVVTEGLLSGLDTSTATVGDAVWLGTSGNLIFWHYGGSTTKPSAPQHLVFIGIVTRVNANNGEIFVKVQNGFELEELHNVAISSPADNEVLTYEVSTGLWKNKSNPADGVTSLTVSAPLTGGTITSTGTIGLDQTGLTIGESQVTGLVNDLAAKAPKASPTFTGTVSGITSTMVGLGNVDNTSDVNKPISTATQTALNNKADITLAIAYALAL
jgi:hypothetical protein